MLLDGGILLVIRELTKEARQRMLDGASLKKLVPRDFEPIAHDRAKSIWKAAFSGLSLAIVGVAEEEVHTIRNTRRLLTMLIFSATNEVSKINMEI
ncbi:hypothetical protein [Bradyrhizobium sp. 25ACV]